MELTIKFEQERLSLFVSLIVEVVIARVVTFAALNNAIDSYKVPSRGTKDGLTNTSVTT